MSKIRGKETKLEKQGWEVLKEARIRFRKNPKGIFGNPDAANKSKKLAIFFDSEFWHGHDWKRRSNDFKSKRKFWIKKIERNIERDKEVNRELKKMGWKVIRIWSRDFRLSYRKKTLSRLKKIGK